MKTTILLLIGLFLSVSAVSAKTAIGTGNGQDKRLEVQSIEVLEEETESVENHGQQVSSQVQQLLQSKLASQSGIGQQVREIAQKQSQAQETIKSGLDKIKARPAWFKKLFGTNKSALDSLNQQLEQNRLRIEALNNLQLQLTNQADSDLIQSTINSLVDQNTALSLSIQNEQKNKSVFAWITALLAK